MQGVMNLIGMYDDNYDDLDDDVVGQNNGASDGENAEQSKSEEREALINRIIEEKGEAAFDSMVRLLEDEDDTVRDIATEVLYRLGDRIASKLEKLVISKIRDEKKNDMTLLYLIDLLGDIGYQSVNKDLTKELVKAISLYDLEEAQLVIYETLAKLGAGEEFYPLLRYMLLEGEESYMFGAQAAMAMSYRNVPEVVHDLVDAIEKGDFRDEDIEIIKKALNNMINMKPSYKEILIGLVGEEHLEEYIQ